jgi:hypothetical protein
VHSPDPALARALVLWQRAAGPYWPYVCAAPFISGRAPRRARAAPVEPRLCELLLALAEPGTAVFVDVAPADALAVTSELSGRGATVVPVVQRWCAAAGFLSARPLVDGLLAVDALGRPRGGAAVFLLDGERAGRGRGPIPPRRFDNRYEYPACRFPPPALLRGKGVESVRWVGRGIAPDLRGYAAGLRAAGLDPLIVDPG